MRSFIRHPSDIPIEFGGVECSGTERLANVSYGGVSVHVGSPLQPGSNVTLRIRWVTPSFEAECRVVWCRPEQGGFLVGVAFLDAEVAFRARMVEQVCHIEHYKRQVKAREGRNLTSQDAAQEWICKHAAEFPSLDSIAKPN